MIQSGQLMTLNLDDILPNRFQPRISFDEEKLEDLATSISKYGVIQPIVVRPVGDKYEIIAGERRYKASKLANKESIPAIIVNLSDKDSEEIALLENVQRQEMNPIEIAVSYKRILDMGYITQEELSKKIGKSQSAILKKIRLLSLDDEVQKYLLNNQISERHARSLLKLTDRDEQVKMLHRIVEERLTVKQTDMEIEKIKTRINDEKIEQDNNVKTTDEIESLFDDDKTAKKENGDDFMDIEKIMREAKDINENEKPKDISGLMSNTGLNSGGMSSSSLMSGNLGTYTVPEPQNNINKNEQNKFVTVTPPPINREVPKSTVNQSGGIFNSIFHQGLNPVPNEVKSTSVANNNQINNNLQSNSVVSEKETESISNAVASALKNYNNVGNTQSINTPNITPQPMPKPEINSLPNGQEATITNSFQPNMVNEAPGVNITPNSNFGNQQATFEKPNLSAPIDDLKKTVPTEEPSFSSIPDTNIYPSANDTQVNTMPSIDIPPVQQEEVPVNNFAHIVKLLRECADNIEKMGYHVSTDELDLGNQYKVTFVINKE